MSRVHRPRLVATCACVIAAACGGKSPTNPPNPGGNSGLTATIDGTAFAAPAGTATAIGAPNGTFSLAGGSAAGTGLAINAFNVGGPGTYPIGVGPTVPGAIASVTASGGAWSTALSGNAGTISFTTVSATRIVGTFSFVATSVTNATGTRTVTNGAFDLPVTSAGTIALAPNAGSKFTGTINGTAWNAATIVMGSRPTSGTLGLILSNTSYNLVLTLAGFSGPGSYALGGGLQRTLLATQLGPNTNWGGPGAASTGSFVVSSVTASRVVGTFDVSLPPSTLNPGTGTLRLVGTFDVGIP
ncbi:MAG: hypothetical protein IPK85_19695 [Gemmatimonadetes bacterium]|nr:hypothetical protein [Gemmatimonadota bacterium]